MTVLSKYDTKFDRVYYTLNIFLFEWKIEYFLLIKLCNFNHVRRLKSRLKCFLKTILISFIMFMCYNANIVILKKIELPDFEIS
jgi:hypothetical protein